MCLPGLVKIYEMVLEISLFHFCTNFKGDSFSHGKTYGTPVIVSTRINLIDWGRNICDTLGSGRFAHCAAEATAQWPRWPQWPRQQKITKFMYPPVFNALIRVDSVRITQRYLALVKLEWLGYHTLKKVWQYVKPFWHNTRERPTDDNAALTWDKKMSK